MSDTKTIVSQLVAIREALGMSQRQVGERMGLGGKTPQSRVSDWEKGRYLPEDDKLIAWARALGMDLVVTKRLVPGGDKPGQE